MLLDGRLGVDLFALMDVLMHVVAIAIFVTLPSVYAAERDGIEVGAGGVGAAG